MTHIRLAEADEDVGPEPELPAPYELALMVPEFRRELG